MMRTLTPALVLLMMCGCTQVAEDAVESDSAASAFATSVIADAATQLKTALSGAISSGGPVAAVETCHVDAPTIHEAAAASQ